MDGLFRNKKVRGLCCLVLLLALVLSLAGCGNGNEAQNTAAEAETVTAQDVGANGVMQSGSSLLLDGIHKTVIEQDRWKDMLRGLGMTVTLLVLSVCIALFLGSGIFMLDYFGGRFWQSVFKYFSRKLQVQVGHSHSRNLVPNPSVTVGAAGFYRERGCRNRQVA